MNRVSHETMTSDHSTWKEQINNWKTDLKSLAESLERINTQTDDAVARKVIKYKNHIKHNSRLLNDLEGTIKVHELFLEEFAEMGAIAPIDDLGHKKNREHMKTFTEKFYKLRKKINKLSQKQGK